MLKRALPLALAATFVLLAHGFILTGMLWGAALAFLIDRRIAAMAVSLLVAAGLSVFGIIHSVLPSGGIYLPWSAELAGSRLPWHWAAAYTAAAAVVVLLSRTAAFREQPPQIAGESSGELHSA